MRSNLFSRWFLFVSAVCVAVALPTGTARADDAHTLKIVKAVYGNLSTDNKVDVTEKVTGMVKDGVLNCDASNDNFGDPSEGEGKQLQVDYTVAGVAKTAKVNEGETLKISDKPVKLVVTKAFYGDLPDGQKTDVTAKVNSAVTADKLSVTADNDTFGDPAEGVTKKLTVEFTFDGKPGTKTVNETETLTISDKGE